MKKIQIVSLCSIVLVIALSFNMHKIWTFKGLERNAEVKVITQFFQFLLIGLSAAVIYIGIICLLHNTLDWYEFPSTTIAFFVGILNNFIWNDLWTFNPNSEKKKICDGTKVHIAEHLDYPLYLLTNLQHFPIFSILLISASETLILKIMRNLARSLTLLVFLFISTFVCFSFTPETVGYTSPQTRKSSVTVIYNYSIQNNNPQLDSYSFGHQTDFWTIDFQTNTWFEVRATLLSVGDNCYLYMDNRTISSIGQSEAVEKCRIYASEFDHTIFPKNVELMGHPDGTLGDIDGDPRITVFLVEGVGSYYLQTNELPGTTISNNREMVYVSSEMNIYNTIEVICHETNHLFLFNYDLDEARYFIEGLAEFSMYYTGYRNNESFHFLSEVNLNSTNFSYFYSHYPDVSMVFFDETYYSIGSYGASYMFLLYVSEKYGMNIISELVPIDELDGPEALEYVLSSNGYNISFNEVFLNFITASTIDQLGIYDDLYGFVNTEFQIYERRYIRSFPSNSIDTLYRYYGTNVQELVEPPDKFTLQIETPASPRSLGLSAVIFDENGYNISQTILTGTDNTTYLYFTGENIESVYIITSMLKEGTPNAIREWMPSPTNLLDLTFKSGLITPETEETSIIFISIVLPVIVVLSIRKHKRRIIAQRI